MLKKIIAILLATLIFGSINQAFAKDNPLVIYFFYGQGCPHCEKEKKFLDKLETEIPELEIKRYEVWKNKENQASLNKLAESLGFEVMGVPVTVVGREAISGFSSEETSGKEIRSLLEYYQRVGCDQETLRMLASSTERCQESRIVPDKYINVPFWKEINISRLSLPLLTVLVAAIDGFNPCAMWTLLFLISLLIGMQDRRRMWMLGLTFILASATVYFFFLAAWLKLLMFVSYVSWLRSLIGLVALIGGAWSLKKYYDSREKGGCVVEKSEKRRMVFSRIRSLVAEQSLWLALLGIALLGLAVNVVELVCSAGLPAVYTQVLALSQLPQWQYYIYLLLYVAVYMADDILVFAIAMKTLEIKAGDSRLGRYSSLFGALIMLIVGFLLIFKPEWLMLS